MNRPEGPALQDRLDALPLPVFFAGAAVVGGLAGAGLAALTDGRVHVAALVLRAVLFAVVLTWLAARQRRRTGGPRVGASVGAATRSGTLPADADPGVWRPALEEQRRAALRARWLGPVVFGSLAVAAVVLAVVLGSAAWAFIAAGGAVLAGIGPLGAGRTLRRVDGLLSALDARSG
jgi:hypothetical protein